MDSLLRVVIAAAMLMIIAAVGFALLTDNFGDLGNTSNRQTSFADCKTWVTQGGDENLQRAEDNNCGQFSDSICPEDEVFDPNVEGGCRPPV